MKIIIYGKTIAKKRPRFFRRGDFVGTYNAQETEEGRWILDARPQIPNKLDGGIFLKCRFVFSYPKAMSKKNRVSAQHIIKPDLDNLLKFVKDCLNGLAWHDDCQVLKIEAIKFYDSDGSGARTEIEILPYAWYYGE